MRKRLLMILMTFVMTMSFIPMLSWIDKVYALESTGNATLDAFINDSRFTDGASWPGNKSPMISPFGSAGCCAYCADYVKYCYGSNNPRSGETFYNTSEIRAGDVLTVGNQSDGTGHWFVCLKRMGNNLYVAEGSTGTNRDRVRIGWNYTISGNKFSQDPRSFTAGYHYLDPASVVSNPEINVGSGVFVIHSAIDDNYCLDIAGDSMENNANIQLYKVLNNQVQKFRIHKWYGSYSCISSVYSGHWLDVKLPAGDKANVKLYYTNSEEENDWTFEDAGDGYVYIRNKTGYYLDVEGDQAVNYANIQLYHFVGNNSQKWRLEDVTNYKKTLPSVSVIHSAINDNYCLDIAGDSTENNANIQLYKVLNNQVQKFRISKWYDKYTCISSVYSGHWLDVKTPVDCGSNVKLYYTNAEEENDWTFEDAGNGYVYIRNKTGYYLDVQGDEAVNYANVQLFHFLGSNSQKWRLEDVTDYSSVPSGVFEIHSAINDNYCLDISGDSTENDANIQLYKVLNNQVQKFKISQANGRYCYIQSVYSGKWLDIKLPIDSGANVKLYKTNTADENQWLFEDAGNGYVYIKNKTGYYLDVQGDKAVNNANIQVYHFIGNNSQRWKLVHVHTLTRTPAKAATESQEGNIEYWTCSSCGKYFKDSAGKIEITKAETVIPKLSPTDPTDPENPSTSTNTNNPTNPSSAAPVNLANGASEGASAAAVTKYLTTRQDDSDAPGSTYGKLTARVSKAGKTSQKVVWNAVPGAVKYNLYANKCGKTNKLLFLGSVTGTSFTHKGLKKGTYYKYMVVAVDKNERVAASSKVVHSATAGGKVGNFKKVKTAAKKNKVNLKTGKKFKLKAKGVKGKGKVKKHRTICYESSNPAVATVSKKGIIKGVAPGQCIVYAYAQNGVFAKVKVTVTVK